MFMSPKRAVTRVGNANPPPEVEEKLLELRTGCKAILATAIKNVNLFQKMTSLKTFRPPAFGPGFTPGPRQTLIIWPFWEKTNASGFPGFIWKARLNGVKPLRSDFPGLPSPHQDSHRW